MWCIGNTVVSRVAVLVLLSSAGLAEIRILRVANSASLTAQLPQPGSLATVFVTGLDGVPSLTAAESLPLPRELAGVRIRFGSRAAPMLAVANLGTYQQLNFQVPELGRYRCLESSWQVFLTVAYGGQEATVEQLVAHKAAGEFFMADGQPAFYHADFSQITASNPAAPGETIVLLATGFGPVVPPVPAGEASPVDPPARVESCFSSIRGVDRYGFVLTSNGVEFVLMPSYFGLMPGITGVFQINVGLPSAETIRASLPKSFEGPWFIHNLHHLCEPCTNADAVRSVYRRLSFSTPP